MKHFDPAEIARPTIADLFAAFLKEQEQRLSGKSFAHYRQVLELLRSSLNGYAHQNLSAPERQLFERCYHAEGDAHREFCELFGPDKILPHLPEFLGHFMVRKVVCSYELKNTAGAATRALARWLGDRGYVDKSQAEREASERLRVARDLPRAAMFAARLADHLDRVGRQVCEDEEALEDHFSIRRVESAAIWLEGMDGALLGPLRLPGALVRQCKVGWTIAGALVKRRGRWQLVEVWNVYP